MLLQTDDVTYIPVIEKEVKPEGHQLSSRLREINRQILQKCMYVLQDLRQHALENDPSMLYQHMTELQSLCEEHVSFEEKECLPLMQQQLDQSKLDLINQDYNSTKQLTPSRPILGPDQFAAGAHYSNIVHGPSGEQGIPGCGTASGAANNSGAGAVAGSDVSVPAGQPIAEGGAQGIFGCGVASGIAGDKHQSEAGSLNISAHRAYVYGSGNKEALLAMRDAGDSSRPQRVQGQYGPRS